METIKFLEGYSFMNYIVNLFLENKDPIFIDANCEIYKLTKIHWLILINL
jgi:hypothetical protein